METAAIAPATPTGPATRLPAWRRWLAPRPPKAVTAVVVGERCLAARVEFEETTNRLKLVHAGEGDASSLERWRTARWFADSAPVLVLAGPERQFLTLDRPPVPQEELAMAVRFPLAEAAELDPEQMLGTALPLLRMSDSMAPQVMAVGARLDAVKAQLARLAAAGIKARSIDVSYSALRGMALMQPPDEDGWVNVTLIGGELAIGLLWQGEFCALRTLALPRRAPRDEHEFENALALHIQRTADLFERQTTRLAVRRVLAALPGLPLSAREAIHAALPLSPALFDLENHLDMDDEGRAACAGNGEMTALICVAVGRLYDLRGLSRPAHEALEARAAQGQPA